MGLGEFKKGGFVWSGEAYDGFFGAVSVNGDGMVRRLGVGCGWLR